MEVTKNDVEKLIELRKESNYLNHFHNVFTRDFRAKGEVGQNEIKVWRQSFWTMTFYPIFRFEFNSENHLIKITDKINPIGKTFNAIIFLSFIFFLLPKSIDELKYGTTWILVSLILFFMCFLIWFARKVYNYEKKIQLEQIFEILDIEVDEKKPIKEWSVKNVIMRILLYPICIGLILLAFFLLFPNGDVILGMGSLGIAGAYLFADIKILIEKKLLATMYNRNGG